MSKLLRCVKCGSMSADMLVINAMDIGMTICPSCVSKQNPTYFIKKVSPGETVDRVLYGDYYQLKDLYKQVGSGFTCTSGDEDKLTEQEIKYLLDKKIEPYEIKKSTKGDKLIQAIHEVTKRY